ncbi:MAG: hypothetical protein A2817_03430 [Candidatus Yanofskybacteria bacterium RIFCSPHIGHO2_01_FULL_39_8b]|uniref:DUF115 domain-containing protein n=1 Tax=Candidatus Yanofskybacteria bacterium RIFCSPHIGHO2_01_FULL_39_8b TaxID=1802659 RepID=A0A1F8EGF1_9BACT|nr:MAG: hypothetical protein A2817_03430 [Candidatus Yanofskybacteria bacterium RIFCSPHIGHO2_01_FULL_39_8b]
MTILKKINHVPQYIYRNILYPKILSWKLKNTLEKNRELKDKYDNKRCFILGNGPSIKNLGITKLKDEFTFVMNEFNYHSQYGLLNHNNHVLSDTAYFSKDEESYFVKELKNKSKLTNSNTVFFLNIYGKEEVEKKNLFQKNKVLYFGTQGIISDKFDFNIELDKFLPWPKNSLLLCLIIASYMGFKKIYLLGCEHNFLCFNINGKTSTTYNHFYDNTQLLKEVRRVNNSDDISDPALKKRKKLTYEENIANALQLFRNYRLFYQKIKKTKPDIEIYNATPDSFLDVFPMINFEDIKF